MSVRRPSDDASAMPNETPSLLEAYLLYPGAAADLMASFWGVAPDGYLACYVAHMLADVEALHPQCDELFHAGASPQCEALCDDSNGELRMSEKVLCQVVQRLTRRLGCHDPDTVRCVNDVVLRLCSEARSNSGVGPGHVGVLEFRGKGRELRPPLRLGMVSADWLTPISMEVAWDDGMGDRQKWSSWDDQNQSGWYEAELLLPSTAFDICVSFKARLPGMTWEVCKVDRTSNSWVVSADKYVEEVILFRYGKEHAFDPVDATFQLVGPIYSCYVAQGWNAARAGEPEDWECWENESSRPKLKEYFAQEVNGSWSKEGLQCEGMPINLEERAAEELDWRTAVAA
eukprot:CAMPEP_0170649840 /NCGR_PEP_ID=MMETSP0224-20130122/45499_1 /TAXON_ID=285029 /ORGANISM="Togula jolla, Strain CCCM 725" /LENGTH=343 /DNA_ID=CAMNT_0010981493 /DNA_START=10 /DNA_END=1041 /DNA_ORIENTATION=+